MSKVNISKRPDLLTTTPTQNTYQGLTQSELLTKVKLLHEQLLKTNKYLMDVHRLSLYNWEETDTGNIMVELSPDNKGFLLDSILRLRGVWDAQNNTPELQAVDETKRGWLYRVDTAIPVATLGIGWKQGDYAFYDEEGHLHNASADMLENLFTPIIPQESPTIDLHTVNHGSGIQLQANLKIAPDIDNDIKSTPQGVYSDAWLKAQGLITVHETPPTQDNTEGGLRIVYVQELPATLYKGYLYLIPQEAINQSNE